MSQRITDVITSEWVKIRTVRSTIYSLLVTFSLCVGIGALVSYGRASHVNDPFEVIVDPTRVSLQGFSIAEIAIGVIGVLVITSEYATGSIRSSLTAVPRRSWVLASKALVLFCVTLVVGEACAFVSFLVGQAIIKGEGANAATLATPGALRGVTLAGLSLALLALLAMGIGTMLRHTAGSITVYVALLLATFLILAALPTDWRQHLAKFLPEVLTGSMRATTGSGSPFEAFSPLTSTLVLGCYAAASLLGGAIVLHRRDA